MLKNISSISQLHAIPKSRHLIISTCPTIVSLGATGLLGLLCFQFGKKKMANRLTMSLNSHLKCYTGDLKWDPAFLSDT